jgi:hypothetical protein
MTYHELIAHTHRDQYEDDPGTAMRIMRRGASGAAVVIAAFGFACLGAGLWEDSVQLWNLGLTTLGLAGMAGIVAAGAYIGELVDRGRRADREHFAEVHEHIGEFRDCLAEILRRLSELEAGERAIAGAVRKMSDPADELGQRRGGGR